MLGSFLASPLAGVLADRYNRKRILIATDLLRAAAVLGLLFVREPQHVWLLFVLTALQVGISGVFFPVRAIRSVGSGLIWVFSTQILLETAPDELRGRVIATEHASFTLLGAVGSACAGAGLELLPLAPLLWLLAPLTLVPGLHWAAYGVRRARKAR